MKRTQKYICQCKATKEIVQDTERTESPIQTFPKEVFCGIRGCVNYAQKEETK